MLLPLLLSVIPAILIGWALKGRLAALAQLRLRGLWLIAAGLAAQVGAEVSVGHWPAVAAARPAIITGAFLLVLVGLARNWRIPGMLVVLLGFVLNFAPVLANGGQMPVSRETMEASGQSGMVANVSDGQPVFGSKDVLLPREQTRLWVLSDTLIIPPPLRRVVSWGDLVTYAGMASVIVLAMRRRPATEPRSAAVLATA